MAFGDSTRTGTFTEPASTLVQGLTQTKLLGGSKRTAPTSSPRPNQSDQPRPHQRQRDTGTSNFEAGRNVPHGDALDRDFWDRLHPGLEQVILAMSDHQANLEAARRVRDFLPAIHVAAAATYPDQVAELEAAGVDITTNLYEEAGQGIADDTCDLLDSRQHSTSSGEDWRSI